MRLRRILGIGAGILMVAGLWIYLLNAPWLGPALAGTPKIMAHRGVHQDFDRVGLTNDSCTATESASRSRRRSKIRSNSMRAAFELGADAVELDVHPTTDVQFAVFHDWTLDCRTEGHGETRAHDMAYLKTLDVGYGYSADGGRTFPLRGKGIGLMPSFADVMQAFSWPGVPRQLQVQRPNGRLAVRGARSCKPLMAGLYLGRLWWRAPNAGGHQGPDRAEGLHHGKREKLPVALPTAGMVWPYSRSLPQHNHSGAHQLRVVAMGLARSDR